MSVSDAGATGSPPGIRRLTAAAWHGTRLYRPILLLLVLLVAGLAITQDGFWTWQNAENLLTGVAGLWVIGLGMTFVLITAGADLSVGAIAALTGIFLAKIVSAGVPGWPALLITLVFGALIGGVLNGGLIGRLRLSFFVVTLATATLLTGVVNIWSGTSSLFVTSSVTADIGLKTIAGLPMPIWIMAVTFLIALWVQRYTYYGRDMYAVGGSLIAARLSGVRTTRTLVITYGISGLAATIAGVITIGRIGVAVPNVDGTVPLAAVAAVLLGGTSLMGGTGGVGGTILGVLFLGTLQNGLSIAGVPSYWQQVVTGIILIVAVGGDRFGLIRGKFRRRTTAVPPNPSDAQAAAAAARPSVGQSVSPVPSVNLAQTISADSDQPITTRSASPRSTT